MDPVIIVAILLIVITVLYRLRHSFRKLKTTKAQEIQDQLKELRKKRDEE